MIREWELGIGTIDFQINNFQKPVRYSRPDRFNGTLHIPTKIVNSL